MSIKNILGDNYIDYEDINYVSETNQGKIYRAFNKISQKECVLKVIDKSQLQLGDYDFLIEQINREEEITKLCNSDYTVNFYRRIENKDYIIFELENFEKDLKEYLSDNGEITNKEFFKKIIISIANALKILQNKGVMHRDIKPNNIFINDEYNNQTIKLGDFGCSIYIKDNTSEPIGTILYTAPEIVKNFTYDEKCDLWSLGVTLFELYFGVLPYGNSPTTSTINSIIYSDEEFIFKKTNIPTLDILFKRLLTINPNNRMTFNEFFKYVFSQDFMKKDVIAVNNDKFYYDLYNAIKKEPIPTINYNIDYEKECNPTEEKKEIKNFDKILTLVEGGHLPDIMNFPNGSENKTEIFNNIIYYDENINYLSEINKDSDYFERITPGAFILCTSIESLKLIREEVLRQIKKDKKTTFNLITTGSKCEKIMNFLGENKDFENCIKNVCVYCMNLERWSPLKKKYKIIYDVCNTRNGVSNFIKNFSSKEIKSFPITKLLTYQDYQDKYKDRHFKVSQFYGDLTVESYNENIKNITNLIKKEEQTNELKNTDKNNLLSGFLTFDLKKDLDTLDKLIIKEYTKNTFYGDLNKWLMNSKMNYYEPIAYFTARLMYSLNKYAKKNDKYLVENKKELHRGVKLSYSNLLPYERAKGKIILLSAFTSTSENEALAKRWAGRQDTISLYKANLKFSVVFIIKNINKKKWISNGIDVQKESQYKIEKEILYQPFSFYYVRDVQIDIKNYMADIYLDTIGKFEILEEKIKVGKEIEYNKSEGIMQIKN